MTPLLDFLVEMEASDEIDRRERRLVERLLRHRLHDFLSLAERNPSVSPYDVETARRFLVQVESGWLGPHCEAPPPEGLSPRPGERLAHLSEVLDA